MPFVTRTLPGALSYIGARSANAQGYMLLVCIYLLFTYYKVCIQCQIEHQFKSFQPAAVQNLTKINHETLRPTVPGPANRELKNGWIRQPFTLKE